MDAAIPPPDAGPLGPARCAEPPLAAGSGGGTRAATGITVNVLLCAQLRDGFGGHELAASLPSGATGAELLAWLSQRNPQLAGLLDVSRLAVSCEYVSLDHRLRDGDEVVVIPPVSGG